MPKRNRRRFRAKGNKKDQQQDKAISKLRRELMPETKNFYRSLAVTACPIVLTFTSLDSIIAGTDAYSRIGNKINAKYLQLNLYLRNTHATDNYQYRCAIVRTGSAALVATTSYLNPGTPMGNWNTAAMVKAGKRAGPGNKSNDLTIMYDSGLIDVDPAGPGVGCYTTKSVIVRRIKIPLNHVSVYETQSTQTPDHNALWFASVGSSVNMNESFESKLTFTDN